MGAAWAIAIPVAVAAIGVEARAATPDIDDLQVQLDALSEAGRYPEATEIARQIVELQREALGPRHTGVAESIDDLATLHYHQRDYAAARSLYEEGLEIWKEALGPRHPRVATSLANLGMLRRTQGDYAAARPLLEEAIGIEREALGPRHPEVAASLDSLAMLLFRQGEYALARPLYEESLDIRREALGPRHTSVASTLNNLAALLYRQGDYPAARPIYEECLDIRREVLGPRHPKVAITLANLAALRMTQGHLAEARLLYEESVDIWREDHASHPDTPPHPSMAESVGGLGSLFHTLGDLAEARLLYEEGLHIVREIFGTRHPAVAKSLHGIASLLQKQGDYVAARHLYEESIDIDREALGPRHPRVSTRLAGLASLLEVQGDYAAARPLFEESLDIRREVFGPRHAAVAASLRGLAGLSSSEGDLATARRLFEQSLDILREIHESDPDAPPHPDVAAGLNNLAAVRRAQGDHEAARVLFEESLDITREVFGPRNLQASASLNNLAGLLRAKGDYAAARPLFEESLDIVREALGPRHPTLATILGNLAGVRFGLGDEAEYRALLTEALGIVEAQLPMLDALSEREALAFLAENRRILDYWVGAHRTPDFAEAAWTHTLRWKGTLGARQRLARATARADTDTAALLESLAEVRRDLARLAFAETAPDDLEAHRERRAALARSAEDLERQLLSASAAFHGDRDVRSATPADLCEALPADTGLVDFVQTSLGYLAFVLTADCVVHRVQLGPAEPLDEAVTAWRGGLANRASSPARVYRRGMAVTEHLWTPLQPLLADVSRVLLVPDGALAAVPFAGLPLADGRYLIEDLHLSYLDRANDLLLEPSTGSRGALVVGGVDFEAAMAETASRQRSALAPCVSAFDPLPGTAREASDVAARWRRVRRKDPLVTLDGADATETAVADALGGKAVAHLATHGFFATSAGCHSALEGTGSAGYDPMLLSGLALAGANRPADPLAPEDGILTAREVAGLDLSQTGLVVLSACETGRGEVQSGQGVLGLRRAFAVAGTQSLVMTLWSVGDNDAATLMDALYKRVLRRRPMTPSGALREAQLEMLRTQRAESGQGRPGTWAAWVASGR